MAKRREIMLRQRVDDEYMASWFSFQPVSKPAPKKFTASPAARMPEPLRRLNRCASQFSERGAFRPTTADSKPSRKSLSVRLAARGHEVAVYCRERHDFTEYRGVRLVSLPTIRHKYFDTLAHTFLSTLHLLTHRVDAALYCNAANAMFTILPRLSGIPVALNVDGIERKRRKWNVFARAWYQGSEYLSTILPNRFVTDAEAIRDYYKERYNKDSLFIPYGADGGRAETQGALDRLGLAPFQYFLYVSRMEPENRALEVRRAFEQVPTAMKLALIGDAPYADEYIRRGARYTGSKGRDPGGHLWAGISGTGVVVLRLHPCHGGRRHASRVDRSHGTRQPRALSRDAGKYGGLRRCRTSVPR